MTILSNRNEPEAFSIDIERALQFIHTANQKGAKYGLDNIKTLLALLGNPQKGLRYVHVAGTNGKGSTCAFIQQILQCAGYTTGFFSSPYLETFHERFRVNGVLISDEEICTFTQQVQEQCLVMEKKWGTHPTEFEIVTAIGFLFFQQKKCELVVLEVGLGGRLDATNVIDEALVCVITSIGYDHMHILGNTLSEIATEKAGIIKPNGCLVIPTLHNEAMEPILKTAFYHKNNIVQIQQNAISFIEANAVYQIFSYLHFTDLKIHLLGQHQLTNASIAIEVAKQLNRKGFVISNVHIRNGLLQTMWPGRFETLQTEPLLLIDAAHNLESAQTLKHTLTTLYPQYIKIFLMGFLKDKDVSNILQHLCPLADEIIPLTPKNPRALHEKTLNDLIKKQFPTKMVHLETSIEKALSPLFMNERATLYTPKPILFCAFGSLYLIGEIRKMFQKHD